jgi:predicted ATPase
MSPDCQCKKETHDSRLVVLTGGPGAGKTALIEAAKRILCSHVVTLPESASIVFGGGFWRKQSIIGRKAAQRAIFHVQRQLETMVIEERTAVMGICDRGALDSLAYWPGSDEEFFTEFQTSIQAEYQRYHAVIHLRTPNNANGYNFQNPIRIESVEEALKIDDRIATAWGNHPNYHAIPSTKNFFDKLSAALGLLKQEVAGCCSP